MKTNPVIDASLAVYGFVPAYTGGGCTAYWHRESGDARISITTDEASLPTDLDQPATLTIDLWRGTDCIHLLTLEFKTFHELVGRLKHIVY
jgi:hypothetical protein